MNELQLLKHGEPLWDAKVNAAIERLNAVGGTIDGLHWSTKTSDGIVLLNGFTASGDGIFYRCLDLQGVKLVSLGLGLYGGNSNEYNYEVAAHLPNNIKPVTAISQWYPGILKDSSLGLYITIGNDGVVTVGVSGTGKIGNKVGYYGAFTYLARS